MRSQPYLRHAWTDFIYTWHKDNTWWCTCVHHIFRDQIQDGRLAAILVVKKKKPCRTRPQPFIGREYIDLVQTWHPDNEWWLTYYTPVFFWYHIQDGWLVTILLVKCVPNHFSEMHSPILFKLDTSTVHDGIHMLLTLFCDLIKDGRLAAIAFVHKYWLAL